jgi:hypothetical protein
MTRWEGPCYQVRGSCCQWASTLQTSTSTSNDLIVVVINMYITAQRMSVMTGLQMLHILTSQPCGLLRRDIQSGLYLRTSRNPFNPRLYICDQRLGFWKRQTETITYLDTRPFIQRLNTHKWMTTHQSESIHICNGVGPFPWTSQVFSILETDFENWIEPLGLGHVSYFII